MVRTVFIMNVAVSGDEPVVLAPREDHLFAKIIGLSVARAGKGGLSENL